MRVLRILLAVCVVLLVYALIAKAIPWFMSLPWWSLPAAAVGLVIVWFLLARKYRKEWLQQRVANRDKP